MLLKKTWAIVEFYHGEAMIEASLNNETKTYYLTHSTNDKNVTFTNEPIKDALDRCKCVKAALDYINNELFKIN